MQTYLLAIYGIDFSHRKALLKNISLVTQSHLKLFFISFNMDSQKNCGILYFIVLKKIIMQMIDEICTMIYTVFIEVVLLRSFALV